MISPIMNVKYGPTTTCRTLPAAHDRKIVQPVVTHNEGRSDVDHGAWTSKSRHQCYKVLSSIDRSLHGNAVKLWLDNNNTLPSLQQTVLIMAVFTNRLV